MQGDDEQLQQIRRAIREMARCDAMTLSAALSMLPDWSDGGTVAVLSAAAHILAERFEDKERALEQFRTLVLRTQQAIDERETDPDAELRAFGEMMKRTGEPFS